MDGMDMIQFGGRNVSRRFKVDETYVPDDFVLHSHTQYFTDIKHLEVKLTQNREQLLINLFVRVNEKDNFQYSDIPFDSDISVSSIRKIIVFSNRNIRFKFELNKKQRCFMKDYIFGFYFVENTSPSSSSTRNGSYEPTSRRDRSRSRERRNRSRSRDRNIHSTRTINRSRERCPEVNKEKETNSKQIENLLGQIEELRKIVEERNKPTVMIPPPPPHISSYPMVSYPTSPHIVSPSNNMEYQYPISPIHNYSFPPPPFMVQQPMVQQPMVQQPMVQQPMVQQPMVQQPMVQQQQVVQPVRKRIDPRLARFSNMK
jgi:hypothetical protein